MNARIAPASDKGFPLPRKRAQQKADTRRRIMDAACTVFSRKGLTGATTAEIAKEAGLAHGSIFAHFGTQEALVAAVIEAFGEGLAHRLHDLVSSGTGTEAVLEGHLKAIGENEVFYSHLVVESHLLPGRARESLVAIQSSIAFHLAPAVEADIGEDRIKPMALHLFFNTWIGLLHHYLANRDLFAPGGSVIERRGKELLVHFMSLVSVPFEPGRGKGVRR